MNELARSKQLIEKHYIASGKIAERWVCLDATAMQRQLLG